jgi:ParB family transcriptional regulator, chromosome partitioning protein
VARGQRTNLASLAAAVGDNSPVEQIRTVPDDLPGRTTDLKDLVANPRNPRDDLGDLDDLASIADMQLQPAVAVTKAAYLKLYPNDEITTKYVVVNGCRRLAAAHKYGRTDLAVVVNDEIARDRITLISASISENVDRQDFDVIEEAKAVQALVAECGRADEAAKRLHKTESWVSQRRSLLALAPELQTALRRGELAIREARSLARVPLEQQVVRWQAALDKKEKPGEGNGSDQHRPPTRSRVITSALGEFDSKPEVLAEVLRTYLGDDGIRTLVTLWDES